MPPGKETSSSSSTTNDTVKPYLSWRRMAQHFVLEVSRASSNSKGLESHFSFCLVGMTTLGAFPIPGPQGPMEGMSTLKLGEDSV
eukprot:scaffold938_cov334-Pavlova_lutheri.AAC.22